MVSWVCHDNSLPRTSKPVWTLWMPWLPLLSGRVIILTFTWQTIEKWQYRCGHISWLGWLKMTWHWPQCLTPRLTCCIVQSGFKNILTFQHQQPSKINCCACAVAAADKTRFNSMTTSTTCTAILWSYFKVVPDRIPLKKCCEKLMSKEQQKDTLTSFNTLVEQNASLPCYNNWLFLHPIDQWMHHWLWQQTDWIHSQEKHS